MPATHSPKQNHLLAAFHAEAYENVFPHLELVRLSLGSTLNPSRERTRVVHFPTTCIVSLVYVTLDGGMDEIAVVGSEGMVGVGSLMGGDTAGSSAVVQSAGYAYRLDANRLAEEFKRSRDTLHLLLRHTQALMTQISQAAACSRHHSVEQRLCRWLLLSHDRMAAEELVVTHEFIAHMLGVRREGVTEAAGRLDAAGLLRLGRGHIAILDRSGLETKACECYAAVRREYGRLLPEVMAAPLRRRPVAACRAAA